MTPLSTSKVRKNAPGRKMKAATPAVAIHCIMLIWVVAKELKLSYHNGYI